MTDQEVKAYMTELGFREVLGGQAYIQGTLTIPAPTAEFFYEELIASTRKTLENFVAWHNDKYDTGYESGIPQKCIEEYISALERKGDSNL